MKLEKLTTEGATRSARRYDDACGAAHALDLVGERWALLVIREMMFGPRRFGELKASLTGISANVLTQKLEGLEGAGVVVRRRLPPPASVQVYDLTDWGREIRPVFGMLGMWAARSPSHDPTLPLSPISLMMSFQTMFHAERAGGLVVTVAFRFGDDRFTARVSQAHLTIERGEIADADVTISGSPPALAGHVYGGQPLGALIDAGALAVEGDLDALERFAALFSLPPKVGAAA
ncbi:MAG: winged helix-turn-helix transcriptional regulator [Alphaproteobacteria bacterium]|nr:winged helix-turn-helix transcriptional regulator [Alphaproteobacteria bacterium]MBU2378813.1 winged helix-turn-helix transcriptional regulator [Alphaproteobacteria bacterium]